MVLTQGFTLHNTEQQACKTILSEEERILKKRSQETETKKQELLQHYNRERQEIAHEIFIEQAPFIMRCLPAWKDTNPKRVQAYYQTLEENDRSKLVYHDVTAHIQTCLRNHGFNPENYTSLHGNALQQEILSEVIDGLKVVATIPNPHPQKSFDSMMHHTTFTLFDSARRVNEMGDCFGASQLIDLATTLADYPAAAVEGTIEGIIEGVHDGIVGTYHLLRHPIKTAQALGKVTVCIAKMAHDYIPLQQPLWLCTTEQERGDYYSHNARILQNWAEVDQKLERWWRETPTREKIRTMTKGISSALTNAVVGHQCMQLAGQVCKLATAEALALCRKVENVEVAAARTPGDLPKMVFNSMNEAERIAEAPATTLISKVQGSKTIIEYGRLHNFPPKNILEALNNIECNAIQGCQRTLEIAIQEFRNMDSAKNVINIVLENSINPETFSTAKGAFYELEMGLKFKNLGETIE